MALEPALQLNPSGLRSEGFVFVEDAIVGQEVDRLRSVGFPLKTTREGLKFCRQRLLEDERIQRVLYSFYSSPCLGVFHWYACDPNQTYIFTKKEGRDPPAVVVHLFTPETRLLLFEGSQLKIFKTWHAPNGMLVVANAALRKAGITGKEVELKCGGMVISDTRLGFRALKGHAIIGIFADKNGDEIQKWDKIELRTIDDLKEEVTEMQKCGVWTNFTFV